MSEKTVAVKADDEKKVTALCSAISQETGFAGFAPIVGQRGRIQGKIPAEFLHSFASILKSRLGFTHLSAISCVDWIDEGQFELVYHFWSYGEKILIQTKVRIDRASPVQATITDIWQPAKFFERDIHEMFGVEFAGNGDLEKFILTDWMGPPPMRKDFITREFAHETYHFKDYAPKWDNKVEGGYHSGRAEADPAASAGTKGGTP
jgi:NADH-quinone oxidoreductase subunit C